EKLEGGPVPSVLPSHFLLPMTVLVTGAGGRLGPFVVARLLDAGARVVALDAVRPEGLPAGVTALAADLTDEAAVEGAFDAAEREARAPGALVHVVGTWAGAPFAETTLADWRRVMDVNLTTLFLCFRAAARRMQARPAGGRPGRGRAGRLLGGEGGRRPPRRGRRGRVRRAHHRRCHRSLDDPLRRRGRRREGRRRRGRGRPLRLPLPRGRRRPQRHRAPGLRDGLRAPHASTASRVSHRSEIVMPRAARASKNGSNGTICSGGAT